MESPTRTFPFLTSPTLLVLTSVTRPICQWPLGRFSSVMRMMSPTVVSAISDVLVAGRCTPCVQKETSAFLGFGSHLVVVSPGMRDQFER